MEADKIARMRADKLQEFNGREERGSLVEADKNSAQDTRSGFSFSSWWFFFFFACCTTVCDREEEGEAAAVTSAGRASFVIDIRGEE